MESVILFDGVCNLCNSAVNFVIDRDKRKHFKFAALQSQKGQSIMGEFNFEGKHLDSIILIEEGRIYHESTAVLRIARRLDALWPVIYVFIIIPKIIRDSCYRFIAQYRYKWFGKKKECRIPTPELQSRFI